MHISEISCHRAVLHGLGIQLPQYAETATKILRYISDLELDRNEVVAENAILCRDLRTLRALQDAAEAEVKRLTAEVNRLTKKGK